MSEVEQALGNEIAAMPSSLNLNFIKNVKASTSSQYTEGLVDVSEASFKKEIPITPTEVPKAEDTAGDTTVAIDATSETPEPSSFTGNSELPSPNESIELIRFSLLPQTESKVQHMQSASKPQTVSPVDIPSLPSVLPGMFPDKEEHSIQTHSSHQTKACDHQDFLKGLSSETDSQQSLVPSLDKDIGVFFSLQFTHMIYSEDFLNRSSPGYKSLENTFLELASSLTFSVFVVYTTSSHIFVFAQLFCTTGVVLKYFLLMVRFPFCIFLL